MDDHPTATRADAPVVVAVTDRLLSGQLAAALAAAGFDAVPTPGLRTVPDVVVDRLCVVIVDAASVDWLREVSDLMLIRPSARFLALMDVESPAELFGAVSAGVAGFVSPGASIDAVVRTVRAVAENGVAIPRGLVGALVDDVRRGRGRSVSTGAGPIDVTEREWEILQLLLQRRSTREIAEMLFVSVGTVRSHISTLGRKLGAVDREDTIRLLERRRG